MARATFTVWAAVLALGWAGQWALAAAGDKHEGAKKDPVADAFLLPKGTHLRADQQQDFDAMKQRKEPGLRAAYDKVEGAKDEKEKTAAAKEMGKIRIEIKNEIHKILAKPAPGAGKAPVPPRQPPRNPRH